MIDIKTYVKKCEDFYVCAETGEKGAFGYEFVEDRKTMYQYIVKGKISLITISDDDMTRQICSSDDGLIDVKKYKHRPLCCYADDDFFMIGFNTLHKNIDWVGEIKKESFYGNDDSWLIVFDGNPSINGKTLKRFDYAKLESKKYDVNLNNGVIGVFTKNSLI